MNKTPNISDSDRQMIPSQRTNNSQVSEREEVAGRVIRSTLPDGSVQYRIETDDSILRRLYNTARTCFRRL